MSAQVTQSANTLSAEFSFKSSDGLRIAYGRWDSHDPVRGVIQIAHGLGEHIGRYAQTIEVLVSAGLTVYGNDHRGHGRTAPDNAHLGDFGEGGFDLLVDDMVCLSRIAKDENQNLPFILFAHGMGSFAAQEYVLDHSREIDALILSGSGALDRLAQLGTSTSVCSNVLNANFEPVLTPFDWLSRDTGVVNAFMNDPLCFADLQPKAFVSFLGAASELSDPLRLGDIRDDLPIYLFSGSEDPIGQQLEGLALLIHRYEKAGLYDISHDFYIGGRHEMLNEINREEVRERLLAWISSILEGPSYRPKASTDA
ncbi:MAG TPA: alpha/beta hydrolase [Pyrinomonadaceae bacterium]|nr:alpha/beta hydrolase [Pyrinomonadaceae bacterium]